MPFLKNSLPIFLLLISLETFSQPTISSFSPTSGPVGTTVTITGTNFSTTPANNIVYFGAVKATVNTATATSLTVIVPTTATFQPISVTVNNLTAYSAFPFTVTFSGAAPQFTSGSFDYTARIDSVNSNIETTKYTLGDIDNDGKVDVITVDKLNNTMTVYRNTTVAGVVSFAAGVNFSTGQSARADAVGDIDGDGKLDVIVSNLNDNTVSVFRNITIGTTISFAARVDFPTAIQPAAICVTDIDKDGKPDLVVNTVNSNGYISVLRNTTSGTTISFATHIDLQALGGSIENVATSDLDGDGKVDIAIPNYGLNTITIFRNTSTTGVISFAPKIDISTPYVQPDQLEIADFNNDQKPDLAISYYIGNFSATTYRNTSTVGSISFSLSNNYNTGSEVGGISLNDFDGDGKPDMAICSGVDSVSLYKNISATGGAISFAANSRFACMWDQPIRNADFDEDGKADLTFWGGVFRTVIWKNKTTEAQITSFTPTSGGPGTIVTITGQNFSGATAVNFGGIPASSFTIVNSTTITAVVGNGASGAVFVSVPYGSDSLSGFTFYPAPTISSFNPTTAATGATIVITGTNLTGATAVSFGGTPAASFTVVSGTTINAVVGAGSSGSVAVTTNGGTASMPGFTFIPSPVITSFTPTSGTVGDVITINGSNFSGTTSVKFGGIPAASFTVVSANTVAATILEGSSGNVSVTTAGGTANAPGFIFIPAPTPVINSFSPLSGNVGSTVTLTGSNFSSVPSENIVFFGAVAATVTSASATSLIVTVPNGATYDLISVTTKYRTGYSSRQFIPTFPGGGNISDSSFQGPLSFTTGISPNCIAVGDLDLDGKLDLATANSTNISDFSVLRNISAGGIISFAPKQDFGQSPFGGYSIRSVDIDGDGKLDVVITNSDGNKFSVFRNISTAGSINFSTGVGFSTSPQHAYALACGDLDGDGKTDVVVGSNQIMIAKNTSVVGNVSFSPLTVYSPSSSVNPRSIAVGDIDGDGKSDIVFIKSLNDSIAIMRNTSTGGNISFAPIVCYATRIDPPASGGPGELSIADMDGDGKSDIILANNWASKSVSIFKNTCSIGVISFGPRTDFLTDQIEPIDLVISDLDGEGKPDIATNHEYVPRIMATLKNISTPGSFSMQNHVDFTDNANYQLIGIEAGDLDGDNMPELISTGASGSPPNMIYIYRNKTNGPHITSFTPSNGISGTTITITGSNFTGASAVSFGGIAASSFTVVSPTLITAVVASGATGVVKVTTPLGVATKSGFFFGQLLTVTSFTPTSGATGTVITITGTNFNGITAVTFGGVNAFNFSVANSTTINATVFNGASGYVKVTNAGGADSLPGFTYIPPPPQITSFNPQSGTTGTTVWISGSNFNGATAVSFGGVAASSFSVSSSSLITAIVGNGASGNVSVTTSGGTAALPGFTYIASAPTISSFTPTSAASGVTVTITGTNFTGATAVSFGGVTASSFTVVNATTITAIVGNGASGNVSVTTSGGTGSLAGFIFIPAPVISSFTPTTGTIGTVVTITGTNLTGATAVKFGGVNATSFTVVNTTTITAVVGSGSSGNVTVTTSGGTGSLAGFNFTTATPVSNLNYSNQKSLIIYPNPTSGQIIVEHPKISKVSKIQIIDMYGRVVKTITIARNLTTTNLSLKEFASGAYRITWSDEEIILGRTVIKQ